ncbi:hypothetical protein K040078D81_45410 [Blautia hominis]|uniref:Uncharacterized protein n=1 Tax=Blautia hominis TaxID=2025493 RepID=A0ABQ0BG64_9FIRM
MSCATNIKSLVVGQSAPNGTRKMKVACSPFLFCRNIKGKELEEKSLAVMRTIMILTGMAVFHNLEMKKQGGFKIRNRIAGKNDAPARPYIKYGYAYQ